jgi:hypothetical protein
MKVLDAVRRRKGQLDLSQGSGILPGAPLVLSHTCLISLTFSISACIGEGGGRGGGGREGGGAYTNILNDNSSKKGIFERCTKSFFTLSILAGGFIIS